MYAKIHMCKITYVCISKFATRLHGCSEGCVFQFCILSGIFFHHIEFQKSESLHNPDGNGIRLSQHEDLDLNLVFSGLNINFHVTRKIWKKGIERLTHY